jgi:hypothetical protein
MNHLINSFDLGRIENSLLQRRDELAQTTSWMFNVVLLVVVLGSFVWFLYVQYQTNKDYAEKEQYDHIPFTPQTWHSATRNVRSEEYGRQLQPFEIEAGYGIP